MKDFGALEIGLSLVFASLFLAVIAVLYYLHWWKKKRVANREIEDDHSDFAKEFLHLIYWKRPSNNTTTTTNQQNLRDPDGENGQEPDPELGSSKDLLLNAFDEEGVEQELMRLHNLAGPPRFLFTIKEETKEDLDSEEGRSRGDNRSIKGSRTRSPSDLMVALDTPFLTPLPSPPLKSPPWTQLECYNNHGFNPLFDSSAGADMNMIRSPPPNFKFLREAEEKLYRRLKEETDKKTEDEKDGQIHQNSADGKYGSFLTLIASKNKEIEVHHSGSRVLPLVSSPSTTLH